MAQRRESVHTPPDRRSSFFMVRVKDECEMVDRKRYILRLSDYLLICRFCFEVEKGILLFLCERVTNYTRF